MQVNQNVNAANFLLVSSQAGSAMETKEDLSAGMDFANVLKNTNNNFVSQSGDSTAKMPSVSQTSKVQESYSTSENVSRDKDAKTDSDSVVDNKDVKNTSTEIDKDASTKESTDTTSKDTQQVDESTKASEADKTDATEEVVTVLEGMEGLLEEDMAVLFETVGNLLQAVMEQFGLNAEELTNKLEEFGMEPAELFTKDGLKSFFLKMNDATVSDLIVNEDLNMHLQSFMSDVSDELEVLESLATDLDAVLTDEEIQSVLKQVVPELEGDEVSSQIMVKDYVEPISDEPEVIITNEKPQEAPEVESSLNNTNSQSEKQEQESVFKQTTKQETTTTEQVSSKQTTFENPILQAIQNAVNNVEATVTAEQPVQQVDIVRQIVEQVRVNMNQQTTSLELQLYPEHLGRIQINVVSKDGVMTASIVAETEAAKQAIEGGLLNLKEAMQQQELKVEAIEVMVSTMGFEKGDEQQQSFNEKGSSNPRRKIDLSELGDVVPVEDEVEIEKMKAAGSSVSYQA